MLGNVVGNSDDWPWRKLMCKSLVGVPLKEAELILGWAQTQLTSLWTRSCHVCLREVGPEVLHLSHGVTAYRVIGLEGFSSMLISPGALSGAGHEPFRRFHGVFQDDSWRSKIPSFCTLKAHHFTECRNPSFCQTTSVRAL